MAASQDLTAGGGGQTVNVTGAAAQLVKNGGGRLEAVLVTAVNTGTTWTFYDFNSITGYVNGTIIGVIPSGTTAGTIFRLQMPTSLGIVAVPTGGSAGSLTTSFC